jgi:cobyrinic acid a,c-diamide synthase
MTPASIARTRAFVVAGTHSGVGKTTTTLALIRAFIHNGLAVQPFKFGPDFIDTAYHGEAAGRPSVNLDLWMMGAENVKTTFERYSGGADIAVIEAMGALFDGENGTDRGSAAFLAKILHVPVVLVIDVWGMTRSVVPLLDGFFRFDPALRFTGFVLNRAGSVRHADMVRRALPEPLRKLCLGHILRHDALEIRERHLGLMTVDENVVQTATRRAAFEEAAKGLDLHRLMPRPRNATYAKVARSIARNPVRIGIARDAAFCFYYAENLRLLEEAGAELCPFSPISDPGVPEGIAGLYLGGGYPESFVDELAGNNSLKQQLRELAGAGMPVYAECGGFMYLGRTLTRANGAAVPMAGIFGLDTLMDPAHLAIRYVAVRTYSESPLGPPGTVARGQEFHQSRIIGRGVGASLYDVESSTGERYQEGYLSGAAMGSYIHLHFASNPDIPRHFVTTCARWAKRMAGA